MRARAWGGVAALRRKSGGTGEGRGRALAWGTNAGPQTARWPGRRGKGAGSLEPWKSRGQRNEAPPNDGRARCAATNYE
ncbi:MAG: hypothetical protein M0Q13_14235 [Methanothrix sp.]|nr:hypothetical protein [Methanothrix sp.]